MLGHILGRCLWLVVYKITMPVMGIMSPEIGQSGKFGANDWFMEGRIDTACGIESLRPVIDGSKGHWQK